MIHGSSHAAKSGISAIFSNADPKLPVMAFYGNCTGGTAGIMHAMKTVNWCKLFSRLQHLSDKKIPLDQIQGIFLFHIDAGFQDLFDQIAFRLRCLDAFRFNGLHLDEAGCTKICDRAGKP